MPSPGKCGTCWGEPLVSADECLGVEKVRVLLSLSLKLFLETMEHVSAFKLPMWPGASLWCLRLVFFPFAIEWWLLIKAIPFHLSAACLFPKQHLPVLPIRDHFCYSSTFLPHLNFFCFRSVAPRWVLNAQQSHVRSILPRRA